jgi:hypothetical protein
MSAGNGSDPKTDSFWVGYLAATIHRALAMSPLESSRFILERALKEFKGSPAGHGLELGEEAE